MYAKNEKKGNLCGFAQTILSISGINPFVGQKAWVPEGRKIWSHAFLANYIMLRENI